MSMTPEQHPTPSQIASLVATTPEQRAREIENERRAEERLERLGQSNAVLTGLRISLEETVTLHASRLGRRGRLKDSTGQHRFRPEWDASETDNTVAHLTAAVQRAAYYLNHIYGLDDGRA